jgi:hypothetical protein
MKKEDFQKYVDYALTVSSIHGSLRPVVEKELLHYEIFSALDEEGLLKHLVFQGGTSLRLCRGSDRFSEDLDFAGGKDFSADRMMKIKDCVTQQIGRRFGLNVKVKEPKRQGEANRVQVDKWTVSVETSPERRNLPKQKIKIEIANIPAYTRELVSLRMNYGVLAGMRPTMVLAESIDEVLADKLVALPTSIGRVIDEAWTPTPSRIRYRDIWDIAWLVEQGAQMDVEMVKMKVDDYGIAHYPELLDKAISHIPGISASNDFRVQMSRFIESRRYDSLFGKPGYEKYFERTVNHLFQNLRRNMVNVATEALPFDADGQRENSRHQIPECEIPNPASRNIDP